MFKFRKNHQLREQLATVVAIAAMRGDEVRQLHRACERKNRLIRRLRNEPHYLNQKSAYSCGYRAALARNEGEIDHLQRQLDAANMQIVQLTNGRQQA